MKRIDATKAGVLLAPENEAENEHLAEIFDHFNSADNNLLGHRMPAGPDDPTEYDRIGLMKKCEGQCTGDDLADLVSRAGHAAAPLVIYALFGLGLGVLLGIIEDILNRIFR